MCFLLHTHYIITVVVVVVEAGVVSYRVSLSSSSVVFMSDFISQKKECKFAQCVRRKNLWPVAAEERECICVMW